MYRKGKVRRAGRKGPGYASDASVGGIEQGAEMELKKSELELLEIRALQQRVREEAPARGHQGESNGTLRFESLPLSVKTQQGLRDAGLLVTTEIQVWLTHFTLISHLISPRCILCSNPFPHCVHYLQLTSAYLPRLRRFRTPWLVGMSLARQRQAVVRHWPSSCPSWRGSSVNGGPPTMD